MSSIQPSQETETDPTKQPSPLQKVVNFLDRKGKLELWSGVLANRMLQDYQQEQKKNQEAESAFVRRQVWGDTSKGDSSEDMANQTILGDVTHPTPIIMAGQQQSSILPALAALALGIMIPGAGVAGYVASKLLAPSPAPVVVPVGNPTTDESLDVGLGRFSDLIQDSQSTK